MIFWGIFSLAVLAVPTLAVLGWLFGQYRSNRRRRKFLERYPERSVAGIRERTTQDLANADTQVMPKVRHRTLPPGPTLDGHISGQLPQPQRVRGYVKRPTPYPRKPALPPDDELMQRILDGLRNLE